MIHLSVLGWLGLFFLGFFVSLYSAIVGGGALILIPLFTLLGIPLLNAIANMRAASAVLQLVSVGAFSWKRHINWRRSLWASLWTLPAALLGAHIAISISQRILGYMVAALMLVVLIVIVKLDLKKVAKRPRNKFFYIYLALGSFVLGVYGGIYGAAYATFLMLFFIFLGDEDLLTASGNSSAVCVVMSIAASYTFARNGLISWDFVLPIILGGSIGTFIAVEIANDKGAPWIKGLLIAVIFLSFGKLLF